MFLALFIDRPAGERVRELITLSASQIAGMMSSLYGAMFVPSMLITNPPPPGLPHWDGGLRKASASLL